MMNFKATRTSAPSDAIGKDVKFDCGSEEEYTWVIKSSGDTGTWKFKINDDCSVYEEATPESTGDSEETSASYIHAVSATIATTAMLASLF